MIKNDVISTQRDRIYNSKRFYGASEKYVTPQNFGSGVFFYIKYDIDDKKMRGYNCSKDENVTNALKRMP